MKKIFFTPGPTELYPVVHNEVVHALNSGICSINHRSTEFIDIYRHTDLQLRKLMSIPDGFLIMFLSSATECMDRLIQNCVAERSYHFVNGAFSERFYRTAVELRKEASSILVEHGHGFELEEVPDMHKPEMICITQNETSTGVCVPMEDIYSIRKAYPDALIAIDIVTAAPFIRPDFRKIDAAFFSVQKGFGMPAGLGVLIANDRCIAKAHSLKDSGVPIGSFHNLISLAEYAGKYQNTETPNLLGIYLLGKVCEHLNSIGHEKIAKETSEKAEMLYDALEKSPHAAPLVRDKRVRSKTVIVVQAGERQAELRKLAYDAGYIVGSGYGKYKSSEIRIANFPMHLKEDVAALSEILVNF